MNLFCFTLEGSTDSIYEPAYSRTIQEVFPKCPSPALLRHKAVQWGGSDPCISADLPRTHSSKLKRNNRRSHVPTSAFNSEALEVGKPDVKAKAQNSEVNGIRAAQSAEAEAAISTPRQRLRKFQRLLHIKKGGQGGAGKEKNAPDDNEPKTDAASTDACPVVACMGLSRRTERKPPEIVQSANHNHLVNDINNREEDIKDRAHHNHHHRHHHHWTPLGSGPQPGTASTHTCHKLRHEPWDCGRDLALPWSSAWDRFGILAQELEAKQAEVSLPQVFHSTQDPGTTQSTRLLRFGRFDAFEHHAAQMKPGDNGGSPEQRMGVADLIVMEKKVKGISQTDRKRMSKAPSEKSGEQTQEGAGDREEVGGGLALTAAHRGRCSDSFGSLSSLHSGQSSSSGVTSGSDCSSNRGSLKLDSDPPSPSSSCCSRQFCGRARVHTDFVPSPYDTESLRLQEGDVIDVIAKPPMGIWRGLLNGKMGNFKFIYVDVLADEGPGTRENLQTNERTRKCRPRTLQELLKRHSLEMYSSSLWLNGYQTVDDLMGLRERHLTELSVADPGHRLRLLAAVESLQDPQQDSEWGKAPDQDPEETCAESAMADTKSCPRDSGCHMPPDTEMKSPPLCPPPAVMSAIS